MKFVNTSLLLMAALVLSGCSLFGDRYRDRADDYLMTEPKQPARLLNGQPMGSTDAYAIPALPVTPSRPDSFEVPIPERLMVDAVAEESASLSQFQAEALNPRLERDGSGSLILRMDGGFANAWSLVTDAIARSDLKLSDLNRSTGTWYLSIERAETDEERSWWDKLWGTPPAMVEDTKMLKLQRARLGVYLSLLDDLDTLADEEQTRRILTDLKQQLEQ